ncbi:copia protein [Tanacetum coccineum]
MWLFLIIAGIDGGGGHFEDGIFTVKELSRMIEETSLHVNDDGQEMLWNKLVPKKVNIFVWRALKGRLPVCLELDKRDINLDSVLCPSCNNATESIGGFFASFGNVNTPTKLTKVWQAVIWTTDYFIWKERNDHVLKNLLCVCSGFGLYCCKSVGQFYVWLQIFHPYVPELQELQDVIGDVNCGFRSVAFALGLPQDQWPCIRSDLVSELDSEHIIVAGAENRPPMLDKSMYDSWASRIRLFIKGKKHGRMMLDSIDNGPLVYPTVEENGQTRPKKYPKLTEAQQLQYDYDVQAMNIILHGLPPDVYALVNHQEAAKDIWDRVKMLMKGTGLSYQELNADCINCLISLLMMTMQQVQVNTKFLNALPSKWSKFVTDVKLAKSLYTTNYDQLYAYLSQHERHANEVRINHERYPDSLAFVANSPTLYNLSWSPQHLGYSMYLPPQQFTPVYATPIHHQHHHTPVNPQQHPVSLTPFISPSMTPQSQTEFPLLDSSLAVLMFQQGEDLIECINKAMAFLSVIALRRRAYGETIYSTKRPRNAAWFKEKLMLAEAQKAGQILDEEQLVFLADPSISEAPTAYQTIPQNSSFQTDNLDAYDSDCDDLSSAKAVLMANLSSCDHEVLFEVPYADSYQNDMINQDVQEM